MIDESHNPDIPDVARQAERDLLRTRDEISNVETDAGPGPATQQVVGESSVPVHPSVDVGQATGAPSSAEEVVEASTCRDDDDEELSRVEAVIQAGVESILKAFDAKLAYDASKQVQVDRLHEELQQHRSDLVTRAARPLVRGMVRLHDDIGKLVSALRAKSADELSPERFFSLLEGLQEDVEIVLGQNGIATFREPSGPFDPRRQRVLRKVTTCEEELAGAVAESLRPGFEQGTEILEKERVATFEYKPALPGESSLSLPEEGSEGGESRPEAQQEEVSHGEF